MLGVSVLCRQILLVSRRQNSEWRSARSRHIPRRRPEMTRPVVEVTYYALERNARVQGGARISSATPVGCQGFEPASCRFARPHL